MTTISFNPGYLYRLVGNHQGSKVALTEWARDRSVAETALRKHLAEDLADGLGDTRNDYTIDCLSADWFA